MKRQDVERRGVRLLVSGRILRVVIVVLGGRVRLITIPIFLCPGDLRTGAGIIRRCGLLLVGGVLSRLNLGFHRAPAHGWRFRHDVVVSAITLDFRSTSFFLNSSPSCLYDKTTVASLHFVEPELDILQCGADRGKTLRGFLQRRDLVTKKPEFFFLGLGANLLRRVDALTTSGSTRVTRLSCLIVRRWCSVAGSSIAVLEQRRISGPGRREHNGCAQVGGLFYSSGDESSSHFFS